jgi:cell division protein FtsI/penicillin-binding protein 2
MKGKKENFRLYVVGCLFAGLTLVLWIRLIDIQVFSRSYYANKARNQGRVTNTVPPVRGGIFDRNGRPLALSVRSFSVSLRPKEVLPKNRERIANALATHLSVAKGTVKKLLRSDKSFVWVERQCSLTDAARSELRALKGVEVHWEADRVYPFGATAAKVVGFVGHDSKGMAGIEAMFDQTLAGTPGWEKVQRDGTYRSRGYQTYAEQKPVDGQHLMLTIDAALQESCEFELERAAISTDAKSGALIVLAVKTGDILALAEYPSAESREPDDLADSLWTIRSISCIYEPGSTFKLVTAAALLETSKVGSFDVFDGENGRAEMGAAIISDAHPYGHLTFREAFVLSSNVVFAKASLNLDPEEFFKFIRLFGFGAKTGIQLLGESPGSLAPIEQWSKRTQITMAFGQEIAATPLQVASAYAAIANDGVMLAPRLIKSVVDAGTGTPKEFDSVRVRRVVSEDTARRLRNFCRSVVQDGTGTRANLSYIELSGKTGTAEKAAAGGGYSASRFVASFVGFAPHHAPEVVCLVILDEPSYDNRFGGISAAPVFAKVMMAIANSTSMFDDALAVDVREEDIVRAEGDWVAPNFLRLDRERAMERARNLELNVLCSGDGKEVIGQEPGPGVAIGRDDVIRLHLSEGLSSARGRKIPDLKGLPLRLARRAAFEAGLRCAVIGSGVVVSQKPAAGAQAGAGVVTIYCKDTSNSQKG